MNDPKSPPKTSHTVTDHGLGLDLAHVHDGEADHDHDDFNFEDGPLEDNPLWIADNVTLTSVGDRKSTRLNSSHSQQSRMPSSA